MQVIVTWSLHSHREQSGYKYRVSHKKGIDKKLLFGAAQGLNLQILNLFEFSLSVSLVYHLKNLETSM